MNADVLAQIRSGQLPSQIKKANGGAPKVPQVSQHVASLAHQVNNVATQSAQGAPAAEGGPHWFTNLWRFPGKLVTFGYVDTAGQARVRRMQQTVEPKAISAATPPTPPTQTPPPRAPRNPNPHLAAIHAAASERTAGTKGFKEMSSAITNDATDLAPLAAKFNFAGKPKVSGELLALALKHGKTDKAKQLIEAGAKFEHLSRLANFGLQQVSKQTVEWMVQNGMDVNARDAKFESLLSVLTLLKHSSAIEYLIAQKGLKLEYRNPERKTAYHLCLDKASIFIALFTKTKEALSPDLLQELIFEAVQLTGANETILLLGEFLKSKQKNLDILERDGKRLIDVVTNRAKVALRKLKMNVPLKKIVVRRQAKPEQTVIGSAGLAKVEQAKPSMSAHIGNDRVIETGKVGPWPTVSFNIAVNGDGELLRSGNISTVLKYTEDLETGDLYPVTTTMQLRLRSLAAVATAPVFAFGSAAYLCSVYPVRQLGSRVFEQMKQAWSQIKNIQIGKALGSLLSIVTRSVPSTLIDVVSSLVELPIFTLSLMYGAMHALISPQKGRKEMHQASKDWGYTSYVHTLGLAAIGNRKDSVVGSDMQKYYAIEEIPVGAAV